MAHTHVYYRLNDALDAHVRQLTEDSSLTTSHECTSSVGDGAATERWTEWEAVLPDRVSFVLSREAAEDLVFEDDGVTLCLDDCDTSVHDGDEWCAASIRFGCRLVSRVERSDGVLLTLDVFEVA